MKIKYINRPFDVKTMDDSGTFEGYASVFEELDSYRDIMKQGAFTKSLAEAQSKNRKVPILWQHNVSNPIGVYVDISEDAHGLKVSGQLNLETQQGREAYALLKQGAVSGISIGYSAVRYDTDSKTGVRRLFEVKLYEASLVTFPALDSARVNDVKTALAGGELPSLQDFEGFLRDAGFSKSQATAIASGGLKQLVRSDSAPNLEEVLKAIRG